MKNEGICTALALYDLDVAYCQKAEHIKALFYYLENWMISHNWPPIRMGLSGDNIPKSTKTKTFKYYKGLLEKNQFQGITDFWIGATPPNHSDDSFDSYLSSSLIMSPDIRSKRFYIYFHNDVIAHNWDYVEGLMRDLSKWVKAGYGIAYRRDFDKGPGIYADGMITGLDAWSTDPVIQEEEEKIAKWFRKYGHPDRYHHGDLRDIYPLNFLSQAHLERQVGNQTLHQWIESSPNHGTLKLLTETLWSWRVPEDKISSVREALRPYGFILCI